MPRTKGSKNKPKTVTADFATQIAEKQSAKEALSAEIASITAKHFKETGENPAHYIAMPGTNTIWDDMDSFYALLQETVPGMEFLPPFQIGATISTHTGPGTTGFCFVKKYEYYHI